MRTRILAAWACLAGLVSSTTGALAAPAEVLTAVNLRTGPGAQYYAIMVLPPGTPVEVYGCLNDVDWCDVAYGNTRGWMSSHYLGDAESWSPEQRIIRPPVYSQPPIYREPRVYANPPPVEQVPEWGPQEVYPGNVYIEPPPGYVYRPPVVTAPRQRIVPPPNVEVYSAPPVVKQPVKPPLVASTPATTAPSTTTTAPTTTTSPTATAPTTTTTQPVTSSPTTTTTTAATTAPTTTTTTVAPSTQTTTTKPKYGGAVGKPGAPCKWVNGVCRND